MGRRTIAALLPALLLASSPAGVAKPSSAAQDPTRTRSTVLLELFTSQGCSSCPPADRLLRELAQDDTLEGRVVPLAFHVDYWNDLGWRDPFSAVAWTDRQRRYARQIGSSVYTPQMVVDGGTDCVGSHESEVRDLIARALARPDLARIRLVLQVDHDVLRARVHTIRMSGAPRDRLAAHVALFEDGLVTPVPRGENAGHRLEHDRVIRALVEVYATPADEDESVGEVEIALDRGWHRPNLGVVAFVQSPRDMRIHAVTEAPLGTPHAANRDAAP